ncbi:MAG: hypothetical protein K6C05_10520 [Anaerovibrio sp.]|uniref:hypothetical protein n=1 Tax=Anaerovibrio sp. TaxID=1872532 RepID=UPI0025DFFDDA|nr:hypothetical protein [Anaerovibrio sp.]MCR5177263.1 hypothetical protein [Anaerovibrio sp.]
MGILNGSKAGATETLSPSIEKGIASKTVAAIAAGLASVGVGFSQVKAIRVANRPGWTGVARIEGLTSIKVLK